MNISSKNLMNPSSVLACIMSTNNISTSIHLEDPKWILKNGGKTSWKILGTFIAEILLGLLDFINLNFGLLTDINPTKKNSLWQS